VQPITSVNSPGATKFDGGYLSSSNERAELSRRSFLISGGELVSAAWLAAHWPSIAVAAHHAEQAGAEVPPRLQFFAAGDAADVEAVCGQIVPSGATVGAREAHAIYFIDRSLATYFTRLAPDYRAGLSGFQSLFRGGSKSKSFAAAGEAEQIAFLKTVDSSAFFESTRMLTVLGMLASPKYGGNYRGSGWKMLGFVDQHAFAPPFGYYDREYEGFLPYPAKA
jgi:Gluconate 2-dehydrogenase subunit 3